MSKVHKGKYWPMFLQFDEEIRIAFNNVYYINSISGLARFREAEYNHSRLLSLHSCKLETINS